MNAALRPYRVVIGRRSAPRLSFEVMAPSVAVAQEQHEDMRLDCERVEAFPLYDVPAVDVDALRRAGAL